MGNKNFNYGLFDIRNTTLNYKERLNIYRKIGFVSLGVYIDEEFMKQGENYADIINYARQIGMKVEQGHVDYHNANMICEKDNSDYINYLESKIKECMLLKIPYLIIHASKGNNPPKLKENALLKIKTLAEKYSNSGVTLCFENVRRNDNLKKVLSLNLPNIKMCFDVGHAFCHESCGLETNKKILKQKNMVVCSHIHNNNLREDLHSVLSEGKIPYQNFLKGLLTVSKSNLLEVFPQKNVVLNKQEFEEFVLKAYKDYKEKVCFYYYNI